MLSGYREIFKVFEDVQRISEYEKIRGFSRRLLGLEKGLKGKRVC